MRKKGNHNNEEWLRQKYEEEKLSGGEIADICGVSTRTVHRRFDEFGIETRSIQESHRTNSDERLRDKQWLREKYVEDQLTTDEIGELVDVAGSAVQSWLHRHGIGTRSPGEAQRIKTAEGLKDKQVMYDLYHRGGLTTHEIADHFDVDQHTVVNWMDKHGIERSMRTQKDPATPDKLRNPEWVREKYVEEKMNITAIAELCDVTRGCVSDWMDIHGIESRGAVGEYAGNWKEGPQLKRDYGSKWYRFAEKTRERDSHKCQRCGIAQSEYKAERGIALDVHHVKPVDTFRHPRKAHTLDNLVTLCRPCHTTVEKKTERLFQLAESCPLAE